MTVSPTILFLLAWVAEPPASAPSPLPSDGVEPLASREEGPSDRAGAAPIIESPFDGTLPTREPSHGSLPPTGALPLGTGPEPHVPPPLDPKHTWLARIDLLFGPVFRSSAANTDTIISTSAELGRMHGFSGSFHTAMIVATDRDSVQAFDFPVGFGAVARGRLRNRPLYGSVGLSAGILVHRAATEQGVVRRVDPDFRLPIRFAWTVGNRPGIGASLALVPGYSVRDRVYQRRGVTVFERSAFRIGLVVGLHFDVIPGRSR